MLLEGLALGLCLWHLVFPLMFIMAQAMRGALGSRCGAQHLGAKRAAEVGVRGRRGARC